MIGGRRVLAVVPARGGSKGVPRKNIRVVGGQPLIGWTLEAARGSKYIDRVVVSTDDAEISDVVEGYGRGIALRRPAELATDEAGSQGVVLHALDACPGFDLGVLLQPTSPLRTAQHIDACLEQLTNRGVDSCISVSAASESPEWMFRIDEQGRMSPLLEPGERAVRRQDAPRLYLPNGAVYAFSIAWFRQAQRFLDPDTLAYVMPGDRSLDIDTEADLAVFEYLASKLQKGKS